MKEITLETNDPNLILELRKLNKIGFIEMMEPMEMAKKLSDTQKIILGATITFFTTTAGIVIANCINNYLSQHPDCHPTVNNEYINYQINIKNLEIIINGEPNNKRDKNYQLKNEK